MAELTLDKTMLQHEVRIDFSRAGKLIDKGHIDAFNGSFRPECLDSNLVEKSRALYNFASGLGMPWDTWDVSLSV